MSFDIIAVERLDGGQKRVYVAELVCGLIESASVKVRYVVCINEMMLPDGRVMNIPMGDPAFCTENESLLNLSGASLVKILDKVNDAQFLRQYEAVVSQMRAKMSGLVMPNKSGLITD